MSTNFVLILQSGPELGRRFDLSGPSLLLGRDPAADVLVDDAEVSRRHARLIAQSGGYAIEDLGSTNGTFVNEQPIKTVLPLRSGDSIRLGEQVVLRYEALPAEEAATGGFAAWQVAPEQPAAAPAPIPQVPLPDAPVAPPRTALPLPEPELAAAPAEAVEGRGARRRERRKGLRLPLPLDKPWMVPVLIIGLLGACAAIFFLWYVDANFLWCDVFGGLIAACR